MIADNYVVIFFLFVSSSMKIYQRSYSQNSMLDLLKYLMILSTITGKKYYKQVFYHV